MSQQVHVSVELSLVDGVKMYRVFSFIDTALEVRSDCGHEDWKLG